MTWNSRAPMIAPMTPHIATEKVSSSVYPAHTAQRTANQMPTRVPTAVKKPCQVIWSGTPSHLNRVGSMLIGIPPGMMRCPPAAIITVVGLFDWIGQRRRGTRTADSPRLAWHVYRDGGDVV